MAIRQTALGMPGALRRLYARRGWMAVKRPGLQPITERPGPDRRHWVAIAWAANVSQSKQPGRRYGPAPKGDGPRGQTQPLLVKAFLANGTTAIADQLAPLTGRQAKRYRHKLGTVQARARRQRAAVPVASAATS